MTALERFKAWALEAEALADDQTLPSGHRVFCRRVVDTLTEALKQANALAETPAGAVRVP